MLRFDGIRLLRIFTIKGQTCETFINIHDVFERQAHAESGISGGPEIITHALHLLDFWPNRSAMYKNIQIFVNGELAQFLHQDLRFNVRVNVRVHNLKSIYIT